MKINHVQKVLNRQTSSDQFGSKSHSKCIYMPKFNLSLFRCFCALCGTQGSQGYSSNIQTSQTILSNIICKLDYQPNIVGFIAKEVQKMCQMCPKQNPDRTITEHIKVPQH